MTAQRKFTFDVSFDHLGPATRRSLGERRFTHEELEQTRAAALAEGRACGLTEAAKSAEALTAQSLAAIANGIATLIAAQDDVVLDTERRATAAMRAIFAKLFPGLAAKDALGEAEAFAAKCLNEAIEEPRIVLRVAGALAEPLRERLDAHAADSGFAGRIVLIADDRLAPGDASAEWADGGAERELAAQRARLDSLLDLGGDQAAPDPLSA